VQLSSAGFFNHRREKVCWSTAKRCSSHQSYDGCREDARFCVITAGDADLYSAELVEFRSDWKMQAGTAVSPPSKPGSFGARIHRRSV
jgi:hypothetical protein